MVKQTDAFDFQGWHIRRCNWFTYCDVNRWHSTGWQNYILHLSERLDVITGVEINSHVRFNFSTFPITWRFSPLRVWEIKTLYGDADIARQWLWHWLWLLRSGSNRHCLGHSRRTLTEGLSSWAAAESLSPPREQQSCIGSKLEICGQS